MWTAIKEFFKQRYMKPPIRFEPRWKEELVCTMDGHTFILEYTMGIETAYLPTQSRWEANAPDWAKDSWSLVRDELTSWCQQKRIPLEIQEDAMVTFSE